MAEQRATESIINWRAFQRQCYETARNNGFHDDDLSDPKTKALRFARDLLLVVSEVIEAFEEYRNGRDFTEILYGYTHADSIKPEGIPIELADVVIRIGDLSELLGVDLGAAIEEKMAYNRTRDRMHGKTC